LNIKGYVKNLKEINKVEAIIQGETQSIKKLLKLSMIGPKMANVENIIKNRINENIKYDNFEIK
tara:strand:- start:1966 stop:2157 length:192 start_codon:yes stop_codon:yes gene_type:complete